MLRLALLAVLLAPLAAAGPVGNAYDAACGPDPIARGGPIDAACEAAESTYDGAGGAVDDLRAACPPGATSVHCAAMAGDPGVGAIRPCADPSSPFASANALLLAATSVIPPAYPGGGEHLCREHWTSAAAAATFILA